MRVGAEGEPYYARVHIPKGWRSLRVAPLLMLILACVANAWRRA